MYLQELPAGFKLRRKEDTREQEREQELTGPDLLKKKNMPADLLTGSTEDYLLHMSKTSVLCVCCD